MQQVRLVLVAPDKYKGTLSATQAAAAMAEGIYPRPCLIAPMADGGEGTAAILGRIAAAEERNGYCLDAQGTAYIDSSYWIGITPERKRDLLAASSAPLGCIVHQLLDPQSPIAQRVVIGIGGTGICDGGAGFLQTLGIDSADSRLIEYYRQRIIGLSDVQAPLLPEHPGQSSALTFAPQKGATAAMLPLLAERLRSVQARYSRGGSSPYDGAGGGLGFAIATAIGAPCYPGAQFVLDAYHIDWSDIDLVLTGEGCIDEQTALGKVVSVVAAAALSHGVPCIAIGGCLRSPAPIPGCLIVDSSAVENPDPASRITASVKNLKQNAKKHGA